MKRHSAWLTDLKALLGGVVVLAVIFVAAAIALPRLGVVPGDAPSTQSVAPSGDGLPAAVGANRADPPAMGAQEAEITPPAPSSADVQPPQTDAAAEDEELAAPAGLGERGGQGAQRGEGGFPLVTAHRASLAARTARRLLRRYRRKPRPNRTLQRRRLLWRRPLRRPAAKFARLRWQARWAQTSTTGPRGAPTPLCPQARC